MPARRRTALHWARKTFSLAKASEGFSRISGITGSGKSHLTKLFLMDVLEELESNDQAKLILYEPKREFYDWLCSLGLSVPINYFMPSDTRSVALDFTADYRDDKDAETLAFAFYPERPSQAESPFWGESLRTIFASVYTAIRRRFEDAGLRETVDLRLMCLVLENAELTRKVLTFDPYQVQAAELMKKGVSETAENIQKSIQSRIGHMKVLAAHMDCAAQERPLFSLRRFIKEKRSGIFVISKDEDYGQWQAPMNGVLFLRFTQLLDKEQQKEGRRIFVVIDEFPSLCDENRCPGVKTMFLRLRSRGAVPLITDHGLTSLLPIYDRDTTAILGQCTNVIYLRQPDFESAQDASHNLGIKRGWETKTSLNYGGKYASITQHDDYFERAHVSPTELQELRPALETFGIEGWAKSPLHEVKEPWPFIIDPETVNRIPKQPEEDYPERGPDSQRFRPLTEPEKEVLENTEWTRYVE